ncbi:MAG: T9SS type A sorting domain-containing protein [Saprospiraceae bacterium]|nr:T9SS type A sorting domain-containing protein [Saprospiraceae bacterium]MCF8249195.1 T9SS type A sorting domain-containing protein [Saprospiraceae bacterium]MCF8280198.1 T9SS type A sorting domain-containing protein [Bacteroidales bacterium]MCF8311324.1 T9SS type A sorting domain-containing protein [Saprospiraceae bacterium]MCF8440112.1 T9SS type A sorting domain-containing protein [Saprospiraceae bacterium]
MKTRLLFLLALCLSANLFAQLTIKVTAIPANTPAGESIHIAGSFQGWDPTDVNSVLDDLGNGQFQITISPPIGVMKYKFTRGSWATVEGTANGGFLPDREYNYTGGLATLTVQIAGWEDVSQGSTAAANVHLLDANFFMPQLNRSRRIMIYLPPDYETTQKHYPVLYMHDGQNLFDQATSFSGEWGVDESLNQLHAQGDYGCIVVGIDNGGGLRIDELAPWVNPDYNEGGEGGQYVDFMVETLKPFVDQNYRTLPSRDFTGIFGSSLGGLISQFGIMEHQDVFSKAGIFSPAFWFNDPEIFDHSANTPKTEGMKIYQLAGYPEVNGSVVNDVNHMETVLLNNGFGVGELYKSFHQDGEHSEWFWEREFPAAYQWLFGDLSISSTNNASNQSLRFYPNPADTSIFIENLPDFPKLSYRIFNLEGKLVKKGKLQTGEPLDVSKLPASSYVLQVFAKQKQVASGQFLVK